MAADAFQEGRYGGSAVLAELARLWDQAGHAARARQARLPSQAELARRSGIPEPTISDWALGKALPRDGGQVAKAGEVLARWAFEDPLPPQEWQRLVEASAAGRRVRPSPPLPGQLVSELADPFALEVHRPVTVESAARLPLLPPYVRRVHDEELARVTALATGGQSVMAVLVGGSSTGKTRACWEAIRSLPAGWRLWHPFDPTRPEAALQGLARVGPRTVVWLNETQQYLNTPGDTGERVAAALATLLADPARTPVLILGTLWPEHRRALTSAGDTRRQARAVVDGVTIQVPPAFTGPALEALRLAARHDPRLAAAAAAPDGEAAQFLAGAPELLTRYHDAPALARAVIEAAMDARRLGHSLALPRAMLQAAVPAYLTGIEWQAAARDWPGNLDEELEYTADANPCKGVAGPVSPIIPRPGDPAAGPPGTAGETAYRLADYLDQHGRRHRAETIPPGGFWAAAGKCAPADQAALGEAARDRGQYRHAAQLWKAAAEHGHPGAAISLVDLMHEVHPADHHAAKLAAAEAFLEDPGHVATLLDSLRDTDQAAALAARAAAAVSLDDPGGVGMLLNRLREAGLTGPAGALAARAVTTVRLDDPIGIDMLLDSLQKAALADQVAVLAARDPAAAVPLDNTGSADMLLNSLRRAGLADQAAALAARAAAAAPLDNSAGVAMLLGSLLMAGLADQVAVLAARDPAAAVPVDNGIGVSMLLESLQDAGLTDQAAALAARAAAAVRLDSLKGVAILLDSLREAGLADQAAALAARAADAARLDNPAAVPLDNPAGVAWLLDRQRGTGRADQAAALAARAAAAVRLDSRAVRLDNLDGVAMLLDSLRESGLTDQAAALACRLPAAGKFRLFQASAGPDFRFGCEPDGSPAGPWGWEDLG